jgi:hypothetical protein
MRFPLTVLPLAALAALALAAPAGAAAAPSCPSLTVASGDATSAIPAGRYRLAPGGGLSCDGAATAVQSYLYEPKTFGGYTVRAAGGVVSVAPRTGARSAATAKCNDFSVVHSDTEVGFPAGVYHRLNFFKTAGQLRCTPPMPDSYDLLRDYLLDGDAHGYKVGPLVGSLATSAGCRFVKNGSAGTVGFTVWCDGKAGSRGACVRAGAAFKDNCGGHY